MRILKPPIKPGSKPPFAWLTDEAWQTASMTERAVLWAAWFADVERVQEEPKDSNRGLWVEEFQRIARCRRGDPWCASFQTAIAHFAGRRDLPGRSAAVYSWAHSIQLQHTNAPRRGDLAYWLNRDHHGHIMLVLKVNRFTIETIEGNAQPGASGDQREGGGVYRRKRLRTPKIKFLRWRIQ